MLDCDKLNKNSSIEEVDYLYRDSMLTPEAEIVYKIVEDTIQCDAVNLDELQCDVQELSELKEYATKQLDLVNKALNRIKDTLTEKQFSKIENDFDKIEELIGDIEYEF